MAERPLRLVRQVGSRIPGRVSAWVGVRVRESECLQHPNPHPPAPLAAMAFNVPFDSDGTPFAQYGEFFIVRRDGINAEIKVGCVPRCTGPGRLGACSTLTRCPAGPSSRPQAACT